MIDLQTIAFMRKYVTEQVSEITQGKSAYQIACDEGFVGTQKEWLESLKADCDLAAYLKREQLVPLTDAEINEICK